MKTLALTEGKRLLVGPNGDLTRSEAERLQRFDEAHASRAGKTVFDWTRRDWIAARGYVGVIQLPRLAIEILPKTDGQPAHTIRSNLLHMIRMGGLLKARQRSLANLDSQHVPLIDAFVACFADSLLETLRSGMDRGYVQKQENLPVVRGRLLVDQQIRHNSIHRERLFVRYDEFSEDSALNRVLKATCRLLLGRVRTFDISRKLQELVQRFDEVSTIFPRRSDFEISLTRRNERFRPHLDFCRLVWSDASPSMSRGKQQSFSLLFSMHQIFEAFIAALLKKNKSALGLPLTQIQVQGRGLHLLRDDAGTRLARLRPDVVGIGNEGETLFVLDTKWKLLDGSAGAPSPSPTDVYQMHAYARRYDAPRTILLFPAAAGLRARTLRFEGTDQRLLIGFVDLNRNLRREQDKLLAELKELFGYGSDSMCGEA